MDREDGAIPFYSGAFTITLPATTNPTGHGVVFELQTKKRGIPWETLDCSIQLIVISHLPGFELFLVQEGLCLYHMERPLQRITLKGKAKQNWNFSFAFSCSSLVVVFISLCVCVCVSGVLLSPLLCFALLCFPMLTFLLRTSTPWIFCSGCYSDI